MARELQEILDSAEITGQTMHPAYTPSTPKAVSVNDHDHDGVYEHANINIQAHIVDNSNPHQTSAALLGLGDVDNTSDLNKPVSSDTQVALNAKEDSDPALQAHLINTANPHGVQASDVGLEDVDNTTDLNKPVSNATQSALNGKSDTGHNHNADYYLKSEHVVQGGTPVQANAPIILDANGQIDPTLISFPTLTPQGPWTPSVGDEYPDLTGIPNGSFWTVTGLTVEYTFLTGDLIGLVTNDGDVMLITVNGWSLVESQIDPTIYLRLDGASPMQADLPLGNNKVTSLGNGTANDDAATFGQVTTGLAEKVDNARVLTDVPAGAVFTDTTDHTALGNIGDNSHAQIDDHMGAVSNPHEVTTGQIGAAPTGQEGGTGTPVGNLLILTQAEYDGMTKLPNTFYIIVG